MELRDQGESRPSFSHARIEIPPNAARVLAALEDAGYEAYAVGGCVRDALMGRKANDWDICTSALPQQSKDVFDAAGYATFDTGMKHGTVTVHIDHEPFEVTTYRSDGMYSDGRHPDTVEFLPDIEGDLLRRDFTVNAMAYHPRRGLVDITGGREDLQAGVLRCVGDPHKRFAEDGLRIMRALRFSSVLGFSIDQDTARAIHEDKGLLALVAMERVSAEFMKLLCGEGVVDLLLEYEDVVAEFLPQLKPMFGFDQHNRYHIYDVWEHSVRACGYIVPNPELRLAALIHDVGKPSCFFTDEEGNGHFHGHPEAGEPIARDICKTLRLPNAVAREVCELVKMHDLPVKLTTKSMRRRIAAVGEGFQRKLYQLNEADIVSHSNLGMEQNLKDLAASKELFEEVLTQMSALSERDLAIDGRDLIALGFEAGPALGTVKKELFSKVVDGDLANERETLLEYAATKLSGM